MVLASCGKKTERPVIVDNPTEEISTALNLENVKNGKSINDKLNEKSAYYDVKLANDISSSLFYQTIELDAYLENRLKEINLKVLLFNEIDSTPFLSEMNNQEYGIKEEKVGVSFKKDNFSGSLYGSLSVSKSISIPEGYSKKENDSAQLVVVYLPTFCTYNDGSQNYIKSYIFVPVYYAYAYSSTVDDYTGSVKNFKVELTENKLLPSKTSE